MRSFRANLVFVGMTAQLSERQVIEVFVDHDIVISLNRVDEISTADFTSPLPSSSALLFRQKFAKFCKKHSNFATQISPAPARERRAGARAMDGGHGAYRAYRPPLVGDQRTRLSALLFLRKARRGWLRQLAKLAKVQQICSIQDLLY